MLPREIDLALAAQTLRTMVRDAATFVIGLNIVIRDFSFLYVSQDITQTVHSSICISYVLIRFKARQLILPPCSFLRYNVTRAGRLYVCAMFSQW